MKFTVIVVLLSLFILFSGCSSAVNKSDELVTSGKRIQKKAPKEIVKFKNKIKPFFQPMGKPVSGYWLARFKEEGQTFEEYINSSPTLPTEKRRTIYIQPIGNFNKRQIRIINLTADFLGKFYNLQTKLLKVKKFETPMSLSNRRTNPNSKIKQIRTGYILDELLKPNLPEDAAALISFTDEDLYPDKNYNFVFGQASLKNRVGVWSLYRLEKDADFKLTLQRTTKIAIHETAHMFSIYHCTKYSCAMNGTNHLGESDKRPLDFCPEDSAKIIWMIEVNAQERYKDLAEFCMNNGLSDEGKLFQEKAKALNDSE